MPTLNWSVTGAASVSIDNGIGVVASTGSLEVTPAVITTYKLTATAADGRTNTATAVVDPNNVATTLDAFE